VHLLGQISGLESCANANGVGDFLAEKFLDLRRIGAADVKLWS
jgi:hypothetical protein